MGHSIQSTFIGDSHPVSNVFRHDHRRRPPRMDAAIGSIEKPQPYARSGVPVIATPILSEAHQGSNNQSRSSLGIPSIGLFNASSNSSSASTNSVGSVSTSLALEKRGDLAIHQSTNSQAALSLPPFRPHGVAPATPCHSVDIDAASFERESSIDSLFDDRANSPLLDAASTSQNAGKPQFMMPLIANTTGPRISEHLKKVCQLKDEDILLTQSRESGWFCRQRPKYISPYPRPGGDLGYLPSSPSLHVRSIKAADDEVASLLNDYRKRLETCISDRDKLMAELQMYSNVDPVTQKSQYQRFKDDIKYLKRAVTVNAKKEEEASKEARYWQNRYFGLVNIYNNLCAQFHQLRQLVQPMQFQVHQTRLTQQCSAPAPIQQNTQVPRLPSNRPAPTSVTSTPATGSAVPSATTSAPMTPSASSAPTPVMVDLTGDADGDMSSQPKKAQNVNSTPATDIPVSQKELFKSMRKKEYRWLGNKNHMQQRFTNALTSQPQPHTNVPSNTANTSSTPTTPNNCRHDRVKDNSVSGRPRQTASSRQIETGVHQTATMPDACDPGDNEFARMMEGNLQGSSDIDTTGSGTISDPATVAADTSEVTEGDDDEFARMLEKDLEASS
uniref:Uncharacterized protein n=1 Tax=Coccidioides posadasii RMSCC 3488 TaxID=454284 RepID=A0A0J6FFP2_COCPO|nr:hypothetical protein CPAG_04482 [Coccidioides posadasii RMSCC 3488]